MSILHNAALHNLLIYIKQLCKALHNAFRISKTDLKIRPIYHRLKERIEAHICISFVSYVLYKDLERVLSMRTSISMKKAVKQINRMQEIMVRLPGNRIHKVKLKKQRIATGNLICNRGCIPKWVSFSENRKLICV